jgi:hypothetical protein
MAESRQDRVNRLKEAYEGYFSHLRSIGAGTNDPSSLGYVIHDDKTRSEVALKLALHEIARPI